MDPKSLQVIARAPVGQDPHEVIASSDGKTAYVSIYGGGRYHALSVIDLAGQKALPDIEYAEDEYSAATGAEALVFVTEWNQFRALDMERIHDLMRAPRIADLRNIYEPADMRALGFEYIGVGR